MLRLSYAAVSDVGRVRKDNQDSGYAGPWLLTVCDGVGGAARGDIASSTAISQLRRLDTEPVVESPDDLLGLVTGALHRAHDRIDELVDEDASLNGTSTTATVALFDGHRAAFGHVGDSRAYLLRDGELSQLTKDHTFVQSLIDEGRITEDEARVHPHRNLILRALDGARGHRARPVPARAGARRPAAAVQRRRQRRAPRRRGSPTSSATAPRLRRRRAGPGGLEAGSSDNVTCVVADVVADDGSPVVDIDGEELTPLLVGAAAELRRRPGRAPMTGLFRGHRTGDTGELEPVPDLPDDVHAIPATRSTPRRPATPRARRTGCCGCAA